MLTKTELDQIYNVVAELLLERGLVSTFTPRLIGTSRKRKPLTLAKDSRDE